MSDHTEIDTSGYAEFDAAEYLADDEAIAVYLREALRDGDRGLLLDCIRDAMRAHTVNEFARDHGLDREELWKLFEEGAEPRPETLTKVMETFAVQELQPIG